MTLTKFALRVASTLMACAILQLTSGAAKAGPIIYTFNQTVVGGNPFGNSANDSIVGTVTTDGTVGTLTASNIIAWDLNLLDNLNPALDFELTATNSAVHLTGQLTADANGLSFNYSSPGYFLIQIEPGFGQGYHFFCLAYSAYPLCSNGETITPNNGFDAAVTTGGSIPTGSQPLDGSTSGAPEPATVLLTASGLVILGGRRLRHLFASIV